MNEGITVQYTPFDRVVVRTPHYSFHLLYDTLEDKIPITDLMMDDEVKEIVYVGSPVLSSEIEKFLSGAIKKKKDKERIITSFVKYYSRMCTRCTPFGLFATCSSGIIGDLTNIVVCEKIVRHTRLDMYFLCELVQTLTKIEEMRLRLKFFPNTSLYGVGNTLRYIEYKYQSDRCIHILSTIEKNPYLNKILRMARKGITFLEMRDYLSSLGFRDAEILAYVNNLVDSQVLVSELDVIVTGGSFADKITDFLNTGDFRSSRIIEIRDSLNSIVSAIKNLDTGTSNLLDRYKRCLSDANRVTGSVKENHLFQVDASRKFKNITIGKEIVEELQNVIVFLRKWNANAVSAHLNNFKKAFYKRYEDREVPLSVALDPELGVGYPVSNGVADLSPALEKFVFPKMKTFRNVNVNVNSILLKKLIEREQSKEREIVFTMEDIKGIQENIEILPDTIYCFFQALKDSKDDLVLDIKTIGASAALLLSRFAYMDSGIMHLIEEICEEERKQKSGCIVAEIAHLPGSRVANILSRPHMRDCEIVFLANSDLPDEKKITVSDLLLSYKNGKLVLFSQKHKKQILPKLTNAHNYYNNIQPIYRFLCDLQHQDTVSSFGFDWGGFSQILSFFPRVRFGKSILSPAKWIVRRDDLKNIVGKTGEDLMKAVDIWASNREIPRYVLYQEGDCELFVDLKSEKSILALFSSVKRHGRFFLVEYLYSHYHSVVIDSRNQEYTNECIVAFHKVLNDGKEK